MNNFIKKNVIFFLIVFIIIFILNYELKNHNTHPPHFKLQYEELLNSKNPSNCIIIGNSHATHGVRPSLLTFQDKQVYNFALNGSNPEFYYKWYNELFRKYYPKPDVILYCVDWYMFDTIWLQRRYEHDSEYFPFLVFIKNLFNYKKYDVKTLISNRFPIIKYRSLGNFKNIIIHQPHKVYIKSDYDRGYIHFENPNHGFDNKALERIKKEQVEYFNKLIKQFSNEGIDMVFIDIPEYGPITNYLNLKSYKLFDEIQKTYNIPMLNYDLDLRSILNIDKKYYTDWGHLNREGSVLFTNNLNNDLNKLFEDK